MAVPLPHLFISQINCIPNFQFKSCTGIFFFLLSVWSLLVLLLFESQRCILSLLVSDWLCRVSYFYLFLYLVFLFCTIFYFYFIIIIFLNARIEIVFFIHNRYSIRYRYTFILSCFKYQTIPDCTGHSMQKYISRPEYLLFIFFF